MQSPVCFYHLGFILTNSDVHVQTRVCTSVLEMWEGGLGHSLMTVSSPWILKKCINYTDFFIFPFRSKAKGFKETSEPSFFLEDTRRVAKNKYWKMSKNRWGNWSPKDHFTQRLLSSSFLTSYSFVKSLFQALVAPFALLHLFYDVTPFGSLHPLAVFPYFLLFSSLLGFPFFLVSLLSARLIFFTFFFFPSLSIFLPLGSLLHFLILVKHG